MKQISILVCLIIMLAMFGCGETVAKGGVSLDSAPLSAGSVLGNVLYSDVRAAINGHAIPSFNIDGNTMVIAEDLMNYGFDVAWDGATSTLRVNGFVPSATVAPMAVPSSSRPGGTFRMNYLATDVRTFVNNIEVTGYNIGGQTIIQFDHLEAYGNVAWDGAARAISLTTREQSVGEVLPIPTIPAQHGNTSGNVLNGGNIGAYAAIQGDWIYYLRIPSDTMMGNVSVGSPALHKIRTDGTEDTVLCYWNFITVDGLFDPSLRLVTSFGMESVNVVGDWVYMHSRYGLGFARVRTDGTGQELLLGGIEIPSEMRGNVRFYDARNHREFFAEYAGWNYPMYITVVDDWIYYVRNHTNHDTDIADYSIYKMRTDGTEKTMLYERLLNRMTSEKFPALNFSVSGDWIYFTMYGDGSGSWSNVGSIHKIRTDGTGLTKLHEQVYLEGDSINVVGDWIYFSAAVLESNNFSIRNSLFKIRTDGTELTEIASGFNSSCRGVNVSGDWIYFIARANAMNLMPQDAIFKIRTDGTELTKLRDVRTPQNTRLNVVGDWIYYYGTNDADSDEGYFRMRTDGTDFQGLRM